MPGIELEEVPHLLGPRRLAGPDIPFPGARVGRPQRDMQTHFRRADRQLLLETCGPLVGALIAMSHHAHEETHDAKQGERREIVRVLDLELSCRRQHPVGGCERRQKRRQQAWSETAGQRGDHHGRVEGDVEGKVADRARQQHRHEQPQEDHHRCDRVSGQRARRRSRACGHAVGSAPVHPVNTTVVCGLGLLRGRSRTRLLG